MQQNTTCNFYWMQFCNMLTSSPLCSSWFWTIFKNSFGWCNDMFQTDIRNMVMEW